MGKQTYTVCLSIYRGRITIVSKGFRIKWEPNLNAYIFGNKYGIEILKLDEIDDEYRDKSEVEKVRHLIKKHLDFLNINPSSTVL
ncbi:hypothetical protein ABEV40_16885, partial [Geobacillus thermocatenulatus]|uniref:hypothetical protein n=1 Tax=Geobacillus thermocatenulatus TaxID=33938 RepID=UPI003D1B232E